MKTVRWSVIVVAFGIVVAVLGQESDKQLQEVAPGGIQMCIDGFVVHRDKIIRTQDSKDMGAKYLTEFDVESRVECMRACCWTPHCDVFIFEEKKPGSCYLFHCGPPHDFKCKFTTHANYSSAVLTDYNLQNAVALEEEIRRNQQEHELKSLRKLEPSPPKEYNYFTNSPPSTSTTPVPTSSTTSSTTQPPIKATCSRNQFECRSADDCIAIYNVCDGIPQCADGSDEAAELGCPVERTTQPPPSPPPPPVPATPKPYIPMLPDVIRYQQMLQQQQQQQQQQRAQYPLMEPGKVWPMQNPSPIAVAQEMRYSGREFAPAPQAAQRLQQQQPIGQQQPSIEEAIVGPGTGMGQQPQTPLTVNYNKLAAGYQWNGYRDPIYEAPPMQGLPAARNKFAGSPALDVMHAAQNAIPPAYEQEQMPRIFNHKGSGIRLEDVEAANGMYGQDSNRVYAPYYPHIIHHNIDTWPAEGNAVQVPQMPVPTPVQSQEQPSVELEKHHTTSTTTPPCDPAKDDATGVKSNNDKTAESGGAVGNKVDSTKAKIKSENSPSGEEEKKAMPASVVKADIHKVHELEIRMPDAHLQQHKSMAIAEHVRRHGPRVNELEMTRPKGAVISLALGLSATGIMIVLIACRMRVVKRRGRGRGHDSYTQDADYLVNGMYL